MADAPDLRLVRCGRSSEQPTYPPQHLLDGVASNDLEVESVRLE